MKSETILVCGEEYEVFYDCGTYDLWCLRPKSDRRYGSPRAKYFVTREEAINMAIKINREGIDSG